MSYRSPESKTWCEGFNSPWVQSILQKGPAGAAVVTTRKPTSPPREASASVIILWPINQ